MTKYERYEKELNKSALDHTELGGIQIFKEGATWCRTYHESEIKKRDDLIVELKSVLKPLKDLTIVYGVEGGLVTGIKKTLFENKISVEEAIAKIEAFEKENA